MANNDDLMYGYTEIRKYQNLEKLCFNYQNQIDLGCVYLNNDIMSMIIKNLSVWKIEHFAKFMFQILAGYLYKTLIIY
jgi:hypothetical protein